MQATHLENTSNKLRLLSIGAGAVGTYVAGSLVLDGHRVAFLEKESAAEEIRQRGMQLKFGDQIHHIPQPLIATSIEEALSYGPFDAALFAMKSYDTQTALASIQAYREDFPPIVCLQNGVDNELLIASVMGTERVIAATLTSAIGRRAVGEISLERLRGVGIAADHPLSNDLADAMNQADLNARLYARASDMKWSKLLTNVIANASAAILDMTPGEIFENQDLFRLEIAQLREALKVMEAQRIQTVDLPGTPVRVLAFAVRSLPTGVSRNLLKNALGSGRGAKMPSFHIDLHNGRGQSEVEYLNGAVVRYGAQYGIPTPVNRLLTETLLAITQGNIPSDTFSHQPYKLVGELAKYSSSI